MKILVTGGSGFVGANLCERLLKDYHEVFCLDNFFSSDRKNIADFLDNGNFHLIEHDIIFPFPKELGEIKFDQIYHLACPASPNKYQQDHIYTLKVNFEGTLNVLNFSKTAKVLFSSTSEIYGDPAEHPQKESYRGNVNPNGIRSCYDEGKRVAESLCMNYYRKFGQPIKIVRIFNTYGPKMDRSDGRVVSNFIIQALKGKKLTIYGDGRQTRSFQYIDDLINGLMTYMDLTEDFPGPINLGNPEEFTILELAEKVRKIINPSLQFEFKELPEDDPIQRCPDIAKAKEKLHWTPQIKLDNGLKKTIEYFRSLETKKSL